MADETQDKAAGNGASQGGTTASGDGGQGGPGPVPYERFKEVNDRLRERDAQRAALEQRLQALEQESGNHKTRAEQLDSDLKREQAARLRLEVALEKGLPAEFVPRLQGETKEQLAVDADVLLPLLKPKTPGVPPAGGGQRPEPLDVSKMTPAQIREKSRELLGSNGKRQ